MNTCLKGYVNLWVEDPHVQESLLCHVWWPLVQCKWRYEVFNMSCDIEGSSNFISGSSSWHGMTPPCQIWWSYILFQQRYNIFSLLCDLSRPRDQRVILLCGWEPLIVSHHPAKLDGHRHCGSEDIDIPVNMVILQQIQDICDCVYLRASAILIFHTAHYM